MCDVLLIRSGESKLLHGENFKGGNKRKLQGSLNLAENSQNMHRDKRCDRRLKFQTGHVHTYKQLHTHKHTRTPLQNSAHEPRGDFSMSSGLLLSNHLKTKRQSLTMFQQ